MLQILKSIILVFSSTFSVSLEEDSYQSSDWKQSESTFQYFLVLFRYFP